jgi:hypothetical protein
VARERPESCSIGLKASAASAYRDIDGGPACPFELIILERSERSVVLTDSLDGVQVRWVLISVSGCVRTFLGVSVSDECVCDVRSLLEEIAVN